MKTSSSSGTLKTLYRNGSYLLFGNRKLKNFSNFIGEIPFTLK